MGEILVPVWQGKWFCSPDCCQYLFLAQRVKILSHSIHCNSILIKIKATKVTFDNFFHYLLDKKITFLLFCSNFDNFFKKVYYRDIFSEYMKYLSIIFISWMYYIYESNFHTKNFTRTQENLFSPPKDSILIWLNLLAKEKCTVYTSEETIIIGVWRLMLWSVTRPFLKKLW